MSCSITSTEAPQLTADVHDDGPERLGLALREAGRGLVEAQHACVEREQAGELDHAAGSGREIGDVGVGVAAETEEVDEVVGVGASRPFHPDRPRQAERGREQAGSVPALERELDGLAHGELGEERRGLERPAQSASGAARR